MPESTIKNESEYEAALAEIEKLWDAKEGTSEASRLNELVELVVQYEEEHYPIEPPTQEAVAQFIKEQND